MPTIHWHSGTSPVQASSLSEPHACRGAETSFVENVRVPPNGVPRDPEARVFVEWQVAEIAVANSTAESTARFFVAVWGGILAGSPLVGWVL